MTYQEYSQTIKQQMMLKDRKNNLHRRRGGKPQEDRRLMLETQPWVLGTNAVKFKDQERHKDFELQRQILGH